MKVQKKIDIYLVKKRNTRPIEIVQADTGIQIEFTVKDFEIPTGTTATLFVQKPSGKFVYQETGITVAGNVITIDLENQAIIEKGNVPYQVELKNGTDEITTFEGLMMVDRSLKDADATESKTVIRAFEELTAEKIAEIKASATAQIALVVAEGNNQIKAVQNASQDEQDAIESKGVEVLATIPEDYQTTYNMAVENKRLKAPAIIQTASGTEVVVTDGSNIPLAGFGLDGKTEQKTFSGKNKLNYDEWKKSSVFNGNAVFENNGVTLTATAQDAYTNASATKLCTVSVNEGDKIAISWEENTNSRGIIYIFPNGKTSGSKSVDNAQNKKIEYTVQSGVTFITFRFGVLDSGTTISYKNIMITVNDDDPTFEPWCGGTSSPNQAYPQDIVNVGHKSRNLLRNNRETTINGGVEFAVDEYGRVIANGTATSAETYLDINRGGEIFEAGEYTVSGCPVGGSATTFRMFVYKNVNGENELIGSIFDKSMTFTLETDCNVWVRTAITLGVTVKDLMFEPMIHKASEKVKEFEPHTDKYIVPIKGTRKNRAKITAVSQIINGVTITVNEDGSIKANGTATANIYFSLGKLNLEHGLFKLSGCSGGSTSTYLLYFQKEDGHGYIHTTDGEKAFTINEGDDEERKLLLAIYKDVTVSNVMFYPMVSVEGGDFEPYKEVVEYLYLDEPLKTTDRLIYGNGASCENHKRKTIVFDGSDDVRLGVNTGLSNTFTVTISDRKETSNGLCDSYSIVTLKELGNVEYGIYFGSKINVRDIDCTTVEEFRAKLQANPITVEYELAEETYTPLPESETIKLKRLQTFYPNTRITNSDGGNMVIDYVTDTKMYIDNKFAQLAAQML